MTPNNPPSDERFPYGTQKMQNHRQKKALLRNIIVKQQKTKRTAAHVSLIIGIAEGGARTHDLEVDLFAFVRATRSTD
jgi:hypothetical protein